MEFPNETVKAAMQAARTCPKNYEVSYHVVAAASREGLQNKVNEFLGQGWQPCGGLSVLVVADCSSPNFYQAMIRY
jgi:hypothetical protein